MTGSPKELAKNRVGELVSNWNSSTGSHFTEQDTVTNFILPFLRALGWDIYNINELKQGSYHVSSGKTVPVERRSSKKPDCVISLNGRPLMVFEFKALVDGGDIDRYQYRKDKLQEEVHYINAKYGILTNFSETIIYDANGKELKRFKCPKEYLDGFDDLWEHLSKERNSFQKG